MIFRKDGCRGFFTLVFYVVALGGCWGPAPTASQSCEPEDLSTGTSIDETLAAGSTIDSYESSGYDGRSNLIY